MPCTPYGKIAGVVRNVREEDREDDRRYSGQLDLRPPRAAPPGLKVERGDQRQARKQSQYAGEDAERQPI